MKRLAVRLVLSYILAAFLVLAAAGLIAGHLLDGYLTQLDKTTGQQRLDQAARVTGVILTQSPDTSPEQLQAALGEAFAGINVTVRQPVAPIAAGSVSTRTGPEPYLVMRAPDSEQARLVTVQRSRQAPITYQVALESPTAIRTGTLRGALLGAGSLGLVLALLLAFGFSRTLTVPLRRMAAAAGLMAEGQWEAPLPADGPAEVRDLADSFRTMAERVGSQFQQLRDDRKRLQQLVAEMAHELKTPIASLRAYHELLQDGEAENPATRSELLARGATQVERLEYLTQSLLEMARLEADSTALNLVEADLGQIVRQAAAAAAPLAGRQDVALDVAVPAEPVLAAADPQRLGEALDNLLQNSLRVTPAGGTIRLSLEVQEGSGLLAVADGGPGIPPELLDGNRLFEPFVRGPGSRGSGLGLAIVRAVALAHGGELRAENRPEGGARFQLKLPAMEAQA